MSAKAGILREVRDEMRRAEAKHGEQLTMPSGAFGGPQAVAVAGMARAITDRRTARGTVTWRDVLMEEFYEALAAGSVEDLREELIQVASTAARWVLAIDSGRQRP